MKKAIGNFLLRVGVSVGMVALVLWSQRAHLRSSLDILRSDVNWIFFTLATVFYVVALAVISLRLMLAFRVQNIHLNFMQTFYLSWIGLFFNLFLPSAIGGDVMKAYYAYKHSNKKMESAATVFWDRLLGFATLGFMAIVAVFGFNQQIDDPRMDSISFLFLGVFAFVLVFFLSKRFAKKFRFIKNLIPSEKLRHSLSNAYHSVYAFKSHKPIFVFTILLSFIGQAIFISVYHWLSLSLGVALNPWLYYVLVPLLTVVSMTPSFGGLGVREASIVYLFQQYMPADRALALSLLYDILIYGLSFLGGIFYAVGGGLKPQELRTLKEKQRELSGS